MPRRLPAAALLALPLILATWLPRATAQPDSITLDGERDSAYTLLAQDPSNDIATVFASEPATAWTDLSALYVATDTANLYVYALLPDYTQLASTGEIGLAIDTTGDSPGSGGSTDPWGNPITFTYTSTLNNISTTAHSTLNTILPDVIIRGNIDGANPADGDLNDGMTELRTWDGSVWSGDSVDWGGLMVPTTTSRIAYSPGNGVELAIPFAHLGIAPTATVNMQFFVTRRPTVENSFGAIDTVPSDDQAATVRSATIQRRLATWPEPSAPQPPTPPPPTEPPPGLCDSAVLGDGAVVVAGLAHLDTDPAYRSPTGGLSPSQSVTLTLRTCAADIASATVLIWNSGEALGSPTYTNALTASASPPDYTRWQVIVQPQPAASDRLYEFQLTDAASTSYFHPAQGDTGPGQWSAVRQARRWLLEMAITPPSEWLLLLPVLRR